MEDDIGNTSVVYICHFKFLGGYFMNKKKYFIILAVFLFAGLGVYSFAGFDSVKSNCPDGRLI